MGKNATNYMNFAKIFESVDFEAFQITPIANVNDIEHLRLNYV